MSDIETEIRSAKAIISRYKQAKRQEEARRSKRANNHHDRYRACPIYQKLLDVGIDSFTAKQMDKQAHKYNIDPNLNVTQTLNALKDHKQPSKSAFAYPTNKERVNPGFQDNTTRSSEPGNKGVSDKKFTPSSMGNDYDSCVESLSADIIDGGLGVDLETAKAKCALQWLGKGTVGGQSKSASLEIPQIPPIYYTMSKIHGGELRELEDKVDKVSDNIKSASTTTTTSKEVAPWLATRMSKGELMIAQDRLDAYNESRIKSSNKQEPITELPAHLRASLTSAEIYNIESQMEQPATSRLRNARSTEEERQNYMRAIHEDAIYKGQE